MRILMMSGDTDRVDRSWSRADQVERLLVGEDADLVVTACAEGIERAQRDRHDVTFLDPNLADLSGPEVLRGLREAGVRTPVVIVSDQARVEAMSRGFGFGADAYVSLPTTSDVLMERIYKALGRVREPPLRINGERVILTHKERQFVELLARRRGEVFSSQATYEHLYGRPADDECMLRVVQVYIGQTRRIIMDGTGGDNLIETVWGNGYRFTEALRG